MVLMVHRDVFVIMGSQAFGGLSQFNPVGPIDAAETVFEAGVLLGQIPNSTRDRSLRAEGSVALTEFHPVSSVCSQGPPPGFRHAGHKLVLDRCPSV